MCPFLALFIVIENKKIKQYVADYINYFELISITYIQPCWTLAGIVIFSLG